MLKQIEKLHFGKSTTGVTISETELEKIEKINEIIEVVNEQSKIINQINETLRIANYNITVVKKVLEE